MQARLRSAVGALCRTLTEAFSPVFGTPRNLAFGDAATEGRSTAFARSDHVHGMPDAPADTLDNLDSIAFAFTDFFYVSTSGLVDIEFYGSLAFGGYDVAGEAGGGGTAELKTGTAANSGAGVFISSGSATTLTQQNLARRMRRFAARVMPAATTTLLADIHCAVGGIRTSTAQRLDLITDGIYFLLDTDASGVGTWHARCSFGESGSGANTKDVDTGVSPRNDGAGNTFFDTFRIDYDGVDATFYINDVQVAKIDSTFIPDATRKICGWGAFVMRDTAGTAVPMVADFLLWEGIRVL